MREVVLFPDTFNNYFEPQVAIAAVEVLERAGFRVIVPRHHLCCGRPLYDQGMLDRAKALLLDVMEALIHSSLSVFRSSAWSRAVS